MSGRYLKPKMRAEAVAGKPNKPIFNARKSTVDFAHAFRRCDDVGQANAELVIDHNDFALSDQCAIDQHIHRFAGHGFQFNHRAVGKLQKVFDGDFGASEFDGDLMLNAAFIYRRKGRPL